MFLHDPHGAIANRSRQVGRIVTRREVAVSEVRRRPGEVIRRVACANERAIVLRRGRPVAAIISLVDLAVLEAAPDLYAATRAAVLVVPGWREMAHKAMDECRVTRTARSAW